MFIEWHLLRRVRYTVVSGMVAVWYDEQLMYICSPQEQKKHGGNTVKMDSQETDCAWKHNLYRTKTR